MIPRVIVRRETADDIASVEAVTSAAFAVAGSTEEPVETRLLRALRADNGWIPALSMGLVRDERVVGHVGCTRGWVGGAAARAGGPPTAPPACQQRETARGMSPPMVGAADPAGEPLIALLGDHR